MLFFVILRVLMLEYILIFSFICLFMLWFYNFQAVVSTVMMKTKLHCDGCAHKIKRIIIKNFEGEFGNLILFHFYLFISTTTLYY